jgi:Flp pilus assembly protein TadD
MESGKFIEAEEIANIALKIEPSNPMAWYAKGMILIRQGVYEEALKKLSVSIELDPAFADAWHYKGIVLQYLGENDDANLALNNSQALGYSNSIIAIPLTTKL